MIWVRYLPRNPRLYLHQYRTFTTGGTRIVNIRPVKVKRPWFRRFATSVLFYGVAFHLWSSLVYAQLDGNTLSDSSATPGALRDGAIDAKKEDIDEDEDVTFIPLSWPRLRPGELYTGNDPEWKDFTKYAQDTKRLDSLKQELEEIVRKKLLRAPQIVRLLGDPVAVAQSWLMVQFPYRAPPHYETLGLEISDNEIALKSKTVPPEQGRLILAALFPLTVTSAMAQAAFVLWKRKLQRVKGMLGVDEDSTKDAIMRIKKMDIRSDLNPSANINLQSYSEWEKSVSSTVEEISSETGDSTRSQPQPQPHDSRVPKIISIMQNFPSQYRDSDLYIAYLTFRIHLMKGQMQRNTIPSRGAFYFSGPIGFKGSKGQCRVEVRGVYDPATATWSTLLINMKDFQYFAQEPLGYRRQS